METQGHADAGDPLRVSQSPRRPFSLSPWLQIALIVLVAAFFRLWQIGSVPPGLFGDEAAEGLDALDVLAGHGQVFFPANYGREGLYIWLVAVSEKFLGVTPFAVRLPAIIIGILTCVVAWWLAREWMGGDAVTRRHGDAGSFLRVSASPRFLLPLSHTYLPLLTGLYLATAYWHVHFSRFSQRTILTPLFVGLAAAAFWRGVNLGRTRWFLLAGVFTGLTLHSYSVGRFFPVFLAVFLLVQWLLADRSGASEPRILTRHWRDILLMFLIAAIIFAPLGYYFLAHPGSFMRRASVVATYAGGNLADTLGVIGRAALANLAQYVLPAAGDRAQFHNLPGRPIFEPLTALLALAGLALVVRRWRGPRQLFLLLWLIVLTAPAALATDRFPTLPRVLGVLPGLYLLPALALGETVARLSRWATRWVPAASAALLLCAAALFVPAATTYRDYFRVWGPSAATFDAFEGDMDAAWRWLDTHAAEGRAYLSSDIFRHPTFMLLGERATVLTYFTHYNPDLSWFDARSALPLPPAGAPATYLIGASAPLSGPAAAVLQALPPQAVIRDPAGQSALTLVTWPADAEAALPVAAGRETAFSEQLALLGAQWAPAADGSPELLLLWRTAGPALADWGGYRLEVAAGDRVASSSFDAFRGPEWVAGGRFITWHRLDLPQPASDLRLRLVRLDTGEPLTQPAAPDGWQRVQAGATR